jgi:hypothetical protein
MAAWTCSHQATNPTGILDSMGVAHLVDEPGTGVELAGLGPSRPLLREPDVPSSDVSTFIGLDDFR